MPNRRVRRISSPGKGTSPRAGARSRSLLLPLGFAVVGLAAGLGLSFAVPSLYEVSVEVAVNPRAGDPVSTADLDLSTLTPEVLRPRRLEAVVTDVDPYPLDAGQPRTPGAAVGRLRENVEIEAAGRGAIRIRYRHTDPVTAMRVLDGLGASLFAGEEVALAASADSPADPAFLDAELGELKRRIEELSARIESLRQPSPRQAPRVDLGALQLQLRTLDDEILEAESRVLELREAPVATPPAPLAGTGPSAAAELRAELEALLVRYTDEHPDVKRLRERLRLEEELEAQAPPAPDDRPDPRALRAAEEEVRRLQAERAGVAAALARENAGPGPPPLEEIALVRERRQLQEEYVERLARQADARTAPAADSSHGPRFRLVSPARLSREPVSPHRAVFGLAGFLGGLTVGGLVGWIAGRPDDRIRGPGEIEALLRAPQLANIPEIRVPWSERHRHRRPRPAR